MMKVEEISQTLTTFCFLLSLIKFCFRDLEIEYWYWIPQGSGMFSMPSNLIGWVWC